MMKMRTFSESRLLQDSSIMLTQFKRNEKNSSTLREKKVPSKTFYT